MSSRCNPRRITPVQTLSACQHWCAWIGDEWNAKCTWATCNECLECLGEWSAPQTCTAPTIIIRTKGWLVGNSAVETYSLLVLSQPLYAQKSRVVLQHGPQQAIQVIKNRFMVLNAVTTQQFCCVKPVCKSFCSSNANAWKQKCTWMTTCGGCPACSGGRCLINADI